MRKFAKLVAAGAVLLSSTSAFAANEGALPAGGAADVKEAAGAGLTTTTLVIVGTTIAAGVVVGITSGAQDTTGTTQ